MPAKTANELRFLDAVNQIAEGEADTVLIAPEARATTR
jgi:hypothetical protein